jgi:hypothetical protein
MQEMRKYLKESTLHVPSSAALTGDCMLSPTQLGSPIDVFFMSEATFAKMKDADANGKLRVDHT